MRSILFALILAPPLVASAEVPPLDPTSDRPVDPPALIPEPTPPVEPVPVQPVATPDAPVLGVAPTPLVVAPRRESGFRFGSYGRIVAGSDLRGGKPEKVKVVAYGPRVVEDSYLELELSYLFVSDNAPGLAEGVTLRPVITVAFDGTLFHDTGQFDARPALRNVYLDAGVTRDLTLWVGSRMYRGDDIYLFDHWPLDDQNTIGGGALYRKKLFARGDQADGHAGDTLELALHAGVNRLNNEFQFQQIDVANPEQGSTTVNQLNRQRMVASSSAAYIVDNGPDKPSLKLKAHGEFHALPAGTRKREDGTFEELPDDRGFVVGAQLGVFGLSSDSRHRRHLNLFARYAAGLAAFDELAPPTSFGNDRKTDRASELSFGASGNWDSKFGNLMLGALSRRFIDADLDTVDHDDGWEYAIAARPLANLTHGVFAGADLSYQVRFPRGLSPTTLVAQDAAIFQIAPMLVYSPIGPSSYDRPQLRLVYRAAHLDEGARDLYVPDDPRHGQTWVHFLGVQAEWWFNSTRYR